MPRAARIVVPGVPHHVVQRGNRKQATFFGAEDYATYLKIAAQAFAEEAVEVWAYCLMPNHVHLIATPSTEKALAAAVSATHVRYTRLINRRAGWSGYLWQGRFSSFPMDDEYLVSCVRYVGLNPVRAGIVRRASEWPWSSARAHMTGCSDPLVSGPSVLNRFGLNAATFFETDAHDDDIRELRKSSVSGRPLGTAAWVKQLEADRAEGSRPAPRTKLGTRTEVHVPA